MGGLLPATPLPPGSLGRNPSDPGEYTTMPTTWINKLYFGDNLPILRDHMPDESADLIYLDPPFNSKATYNVLFRERNGSDSAAQITAFDDFWHWDMEAERTYHEVVTQGPRKVADLLQALRQFLGQNDMMAYLTMMAIRLVELQRVLKPSGSIYLHCDPTASHYLKIVMDAVFGARGFRTEVIWERVRSTASSKARATSFPRNHDVILVYVGAGPSNTFNRIYMPYSEEYLARYRHEDERGRYYWDNLKTYSEETLQRLIREDRVKMPLTPGRNPRFKNYLQEGKGDLLSNVWTDIPPINSQARERLGYPTQKPEALLDRIIQASSNEGDLVLDPFCGCGTTIAVAERLHRRWIGIDITHLAVALMKNRLRDTFGPDLNPYEVLGEPEDVASARALAEENRYQFEYWALGLVDARPAGDKKKGADEGIDGIVAFFDDDSGKAKRVVIQVKSGKVSVQQIRDLKGVMDREKAPIGAFVTLQEPTGPMRTEAAAAGFYDPPGLLPAVPRLQILTIDELLAGKELEYPDVAPATFKRAGRKSKAKPKAKGQGDLFE